MSEIVAGLYELKKQIGAGGGGVVYLGRHIRLDKDIVLKADKRSLTVGEDALRREVDMLKGLSQTYIPQVYDFVQEGGIVYTVMDYIPGESMDRVLERGDKLPQAQVIRWACQLLEALEYLHSRPPHGILHGDIKPANIMLRSDGNICLIDFNIALALGENGAVKVGFSRGYASPEHYGMEYASDRRKALQEAKRETGKKKKPADDDATVDMSSGMSGNTETMAMSTGPLSSQGKTGGTRDAILLDIRSDVYSLGATLYHMLSGCRPAQDARSVAPLSAQDCSPGVAAIIARAMSLSPEDRYQTAGQMREAFLSLHRTDARMVRHRRRIAASVAALSAVFLAGGATAFIGLKQLEQRQTAQALAEYSAKALSEGNVPLAVERALQAVPRGGSILEAPPTAEAQKALADALGVYDLSDGFKSVASIELPGAPFDLALSPEGRRLAVVYGYEAAVYDLETQERLAVLPVQESALSDCLFLDEDRVVYAGREGIALYDLAGQRDVWTGEAATTLALSADGKAVAAVDRDADHAVVYDTATGSKKADCSFRGSHMAVAANDIFADPKDSIFALNGDGTMLAVSFSGGGLAVFDLSLPGGEGDLLIYDTSGYSRFQGGFCGRYFVYAADGDGALFGLVDTAEGVMAGEVESKDRFLLKADENSIYLGSGNALVKLDPDTLEELEIAYTGSVAMTNFAIGGQYAAAATEDFRFSFFDGGANLIGTEEGSQNADFLELAGGYAAIGNRTETALRIMRMEGHGEAKLASYSPRYSHEEARVSAADGTVMLFGYQDFALFYMDGEPVAEVPLPDAEKIYDQQFRREADRAFLEVIWYDGTRRRYSAADGKLLSEEAGEAPSKDLYEEFQTGKYRIVSSLHEAPVVYGRESGKELARLESDGYLTYAEDLGEYLVTEYIDTEGKRYGLLLDGRLEIIARLPGLCDIAGDKLVFDYGAGELRQGRVYSLAELVEMGKGYSE